MAQDHKELEEMPIWQNHENRITTLENIVASVPGKMEKIDKLETTITRVEESYKKGNQEQKELLDTLIQHHLSTNKMKLSNFWKVILNITGAGGLVVAVIYAVVELIQFFSKGGL